MFTWHSRLTNALFLYLASARSIVIGIAIPPFNLHPCLPPFLASSEAIV